MNSDNDRHAKAVSAVSLNFGDCSVHPDYIHQLFDNEVICGYNSDDDDEHLLISISISPSCRSCSIEYHLRSMNNKSIGNDGGSSNKKRVGFSLPSTKKVKEKMKIDEITEKLQLALPPIVKTATITDDCGETKRFRREASHSLIKDDYLAEPIGSLLRKYQRNYNGTQRHFALYVAEASETTAHFHNLVQPLALWFIETANCVDILDTNGSWKILYVFENHKQEEEETMKKQKYSLVGYTTLYYFNSPFRKPIPGYIVRVCQMLILPQHQRRGHGLEMMESLYQDLVTPEIVEINVEDPSPNFTALRNRIDYELLQKNIDAVKNTDQSIHGILPLKNINAADDPLSCFLTLTESETVKAAQMAKITPNQIGKYYYRDNVVRSFPFRSRSVITVVLSDVPNIFVS